MVEAAPVVLRHINQAPRKTEACREQGRRHSRVALRGKAEALRAARDAERNTNRQPAVLEAPGRIGALILQVEIDAVLSGERVAPDRLRQSDIGGI